jgi:hypothetical protein
LRAAPIFVSATEAELVAYRRARRELGEQPIDEVTWEREAVVINRLYGSCRTAQ